MNLTGNNRRSIGIEDAPLASGGQGSVHRLSGSSEQHKVAKIFHENILRDSSKISAIRAKVEFMIRYSPLNGARPEVKKSLIWPLEALYRQGRFVGFLMPFAGNPSGNEQVVSLRYLTLPQSPALKFGRAWGKFDITHPKAIQTRMALCYNIAQAIQQLHSTGLYVLVDMKPDNILIDERGFMYIIDLDSVQITVKDQVRFHADVFTEDYCPQEFFQRKFNPRHSRISPAWDYFSYGILAYQLLNALHPYQASHDHYHTLPERIEQQLFVHGRNKGALHVIPHPHQHFQQLPASIQQLFMACFETQHIHGTGCPDLKTWAHIIHQSLNKPPIIDRFTASTNVRKDAQPVTLAWQVSNAEQVKVEGASASAQGTLQVQPLQRTDYRIEAVAFNGKKVAKKITVDVSSDPAEIHYFKTDKTVLKTREPVTLSWSTNGATEVELSPSIGAVGTVSSKVVFPNRETVYELKVTNWLGQTRTQTLRIEVSKDPPEIKTFRSDKTQLDDASPAQLTWTVHDAHKLHLQPGNINVAGKSSVKVSPKTDTQYELIATSYFGVTTRSSLNITTSKEPPKILSFTSDVARLEEAKPTALHWKVEKAARIRIEPETGDVTGKSSVQVLPKHPTTYKLIATSYFGIESSKTLHIETSTRPPVIHAFRSDRAQLTDDRPVALSWGVDRAHALEITPQIGTVTGKQNIQAHISADTTFTLRATSFFGIQAEHQLEVTVSKEPPRIAYFTATPCDFTDEKDVILSWHIVGAKSATLNPSVGAVPLQGSTTQGLQTAQEMKLRALGYFGFDSEATVMAQPSIIALEPNTMIALESDGFPVQIDDSDFIQPPQF